MSPPAGEKVAKDTKITLTIAIPIPPPETTTPTPTAPTTEPT
jgi:hypothetical protein